MDNDTTIMVIILIVIFCLYVCCAGIYCFINEKILKKQYTVTPTPTPSNSIV